MSQQSIFSEDEIILPATVPLQLRESLKLTLPLSLPERRLYLYVEVRQSAAAEFFMWGEVQLTKGNVPVGKFPAKLASFSGAPAPVNKSVSTLFNAGGSPVGDSIVLTLAQPFDAAVTSVVIQPLRVNVECDKVVFSMEGLRGTNLTGFRAYLACNSTRY